MLRTILIFIGINAALGWFLAQHLLSRTKIGPAATASVSAMEKPSLDRFQQLQKKMTFEKSKQILGTPDQVRNKTRNGMFVLIATWKVNGSGANTISAYFTNDRLIEAEWLHLGYFFIEL